MKTKLILIGGSAVGKSTVKTELSKIFKSEVSFTTRKPRSGEVNGVDYHFVSKRKFESFIDHGLLLQYNQVNGNYYGTTLEAFNDNSLFIMSPNAISKLTEAQRSEAFVIYLTAKLSVIIERLVVRKSNSYEDILKRLSADSDEFHNFSEWDTLIDTSSIDEITTCWSILEQFAKFYNLSH